MKNAIISLLCIFALVSCSNENEDMGVGCLDSSEQFFENEDMIVGCLDSSDQFFQRIEILSDPNDDHSWVVRHGEGAAYLNEGQLQKVPVQRLLTGYQFTDFIKVAGNKLYGALMPGAGSRRLFAFPITDYSYDSQTKYLKIDGNYYFLEKASGEAMSFSPFLESHIEEGIEFNGLLSTYKPGSIDSDVTVLWFNSRAAFNEWWSVPENRKVE